MHLERAAWASREASTVALVASAAPRPRSQRLAARSVCVSRAQAAATGWAWTASGAPLLPGYLSIEQGVTFESLGRVGYAAWDAVPDNGKFQIIGIIGILELLGEAAVKPHYMMGGTPGKIPLLWDPLGFTKNLSPETLARKRTAELKNGRLAMIGVASFVSAHYIPDSVPLLPAVV